MIRQRTPNGAAQFLGDLRERRALPEPPRSAQVRGQVAVAQAKPSLLAHAFERRQAMERFAGEAPSLGAVYNARQSVEHGVNIGRDVEAVKLGVIAGVGDDGDLLRGHHIRQPFPEISRLPRRQPVQ